MQFPLLFRLGSDWGSSTFFLPTLIYLLLLFASRVWILFLANQNTSLVYSSALMPASHPCVSLLMFQGCYSGSGLFPFSLVEASSETAHGPFLSPLDPEHQEVWVGGCTCTSTSLLALATAIPEETPTLMDLWLLWLLQLLLLLWRLLASLVFLVREGLEG